MAYCAYELPLLWQAAYLVPYPTSGSRIFATPSIGPAPGGTNTFSHLQIVSCQTPFAVADSRLSPAALTLYPCPVRPAREKHSDL
jgi:hypothetical protein